MAFVIFRARFKLAVEAQEQALNRVTNIFLPASSQYFQTYIKEINL